MFIIFKTISFTVNVTTIYCFQALIILNTVTEDQIIDVQCHSILTFKQFQTTQL